MFRIAYTVVSVIVLTVQVAAVAVGLFFIIGSALGATWVPAAYEGNDCIVGDTFRIQSPELSLGEDLNCTIERSMALIGTAETVITGVAVCATDMPSIERMRFAMTIAPGRESMMLEWDGLPPEPYRLCAE